MYKINLKNHIDQMLVFFRKIASIHSLSFTTHEVFQNKIIGLDKVNKTLLVVESNGQNYGSKFIDLGEVKTCRLKRIYHAIKADGFNKKKLHDYLSAVTLEFYFKNNNSPFVLDFYKPQTNIIYKVADLEKKARRWEALLSKILAPLQPQVLTPQPVKL